MVFFRVVGADYAFREYGVTPQELDAFDQVAEKRCQRSKRLGKLITKTAHS